MGKGGTDPLGNILPNSASGGAAAMAFGVTCINFLHTARISVERVAENIITCFSWGVALKISCSEPVDQTE